MKIGEREFLMEAFEVLPKIIVFKVIRISDEWFGEWWK